MFIKFFKLFITFMVLIFPSFVYADGRLDNCLQYKDEIVSLLESEDVSSDYFYLAVCESGCKIKPSNKGARGIFQLMPLTFKNYHDASCKNIDDIKCNTIAAARYIKHLQERFKQIHILIKAYNRGGTNYIRHGTTTEANKLSACVMNYIRNYGD